MDQGKIHKREEDAKDKEAEHEKRETELRDMFSAIDGLQDEIKGQDAMRETMEEEYNFKLSEMQDLAVEEKKSLQDTIWESKLEIRELQVPLVTWLPLSLYLCLRLSAPAYARIVSGTLLI